MSERTAFHKEGEKKKHFHLFPERPPSKTLAQTRESPNHNLHLLTGQPHISNTFLVRIPKNFKELETTHHKTSKQISPAEAYVTRCSNIITEQEKLQTTDLVHIPTYLV
jgi:hypothetical protein